ncbi:hypothetical protein ACS5PN_09420 [Roseateles sp. NT4]|uniref:hypothetical protein n=1 Tax=Roseateles sp. NT4 TaxID=3453715 RepID=UPI003EEE9C3D
MQKIRRLSLILVAALVAGCAHGPGSPEPMPQVSYASEAELRLGAQAVAEAFAAEVAKARGGMLAATPAIEVRNTPQLIFFNAASNTIVLPWWDSQPPEMRAIFRQFADGTDAGAERLFRAFFNSFLIAHEAGHWFQNNASRREPTLYGNENNANRLAVAFWRTQPGGERYLAQLEKLAADAAAHLPNPTPAGEDPVAYFGANYRALAREPLKYGYYQFQFMAEALRDRRQLDFAQMVKQPAER